MKNKICFTIIYFTLIVSCTNPPKEPEKTEPEAYKEIVKKITSPDFNADTAYAFVKKQVDFGPRVPGSKAHAACAEYFQKKLKAYGLKVEMQQAPITTFDGNNYTLKNIFASYKPELKNRILLTTHWDSRPFADEDTKDIGKAIDGANDGASGVGVLLEIARTISLNNPEIGVDIFLNDLEDYGQPDNTMGARKEDTWCLGSQYWAKNKPKEYAPKFGILLDMVGGQNPIFPMEGTSMYYAPDVVQKVWKIAAELGYANTFTADRMGQTTDDHLYINSIANIPCIDIVHMDPATGTYPTFHHTHADNMSIIEKSTLKMVGQTVMQVIYEEM